MQQIPSTQSSDPLSRNWDWVSIFLVWASILTVTRRLLVTNWTEDLYLIAYIVNLAFIIGLALGYSRFRPLITSGFAFLYGVFFIGWRVGLLQNSTPLWSEKISTVLLRLSITMYRLSSRQAVYDNLLFLLLMMILFWIIGLYTAYNLVRSPTPLRIIGPLFLVILLIHSYDPLVSARDGYLYFFSILAVLVIARLFYLQQKAGWRNIPIYLPPQLSSDALQLTIGLALFFLLVSFILPSNRSQLEAMVRVWEKIKEPFQSIRQDFENAFSSLRVTSQLHVEFYERTLNLGFGNELGEEEIFVAVAQAKIPPEARIYWRSRVYDHYENGQWTISDYSTREFDANAFDGDFPIFTQRPSRLFPFTISTNQPIRTLILPAQPYWTNLAVQMEYYPNPDGTFDLLSLRSVSPVAGGRTYHARSSLSLITVEQLRQAGEEVPAWVSERYLQLPTTLTDRTRNLALEITKGLPSSYDKTIAIIDYLRSHITYIATLEELPANQDLIDWFLFESKKGFCNYYATAAVLLLRSIGIPARLAVGFAEGTVEDIQATTVYVVRQRDAHAWPEVFFPDIGWIEFEPTSSQPPVSYPFHQEEDDTQTNTLSPEINPQEILQELRAEKEKEGGNRFHSTGKGPLFLSLVLLIVILTAMLIWLNIRRSKGALAYRHLPQILEQGIRVMGFTPPKLLVAWNQFLNLSPIEKSYHRINTALRLLGHPSPPHYTPAERAARLLELLPEAEVAIKELIQAYQDSFYGTIPLAEPEINKLAQNILRLAWRKRLQNDLRHLFNGRQ